jgi:DNA polymerase I-like protein with 3'-5' exonuclease and polymerase domains
LAISSLVLLRRICILWVRACREGGIRVVGQFHDEIIALVKKGDEKKTEDLMRYAISQTNAVVKLNVPLGIDYSFGKNYSEIH